MSDINVLEALEQVDASAAGQLFPEWLRGQMRSLIVDIGVAVLDCRYSSIYRPAIVRYEWCATDSYACWRALSQHSVPFNASAICIAVS